MILILIIWVIPFIILILTIDHYSILSVVVHSWAIGCQVTAAIDMVFCRAWRLAGNATLAIRPFVAEDFDARMKGATNRKLPWEW